jgi:hypothetical protein
MNTMPVSAEAVTRGYLNGLRELLADKMDGSARIVAEPSADPQKHLSPPAPLPPAVL